MTCQPFGSTQAHAGGNTPAGSNTESQQWSQPQATRLGAETPVLPGAYIQLAAVL